MTSTYKADGISSSPTPNSSTGSSGHKNNIKGTKLARRARSFKDDLFEKISQMRTPTNTLGRSHSPHSPRSKHVKPHHTDELKPTQNLEIHVRHIKNALKHFRDVVSKRKLEVVPGNGTVVLELIASLYTALQPYTLNENSSTLISATTQVYLSLGKLIKLCDEVLLCDDETQCVSLSEENVKEVVELVENAVQNLVNIANEKLKEKDNNSSLSTMSSSPNTLCRPSIDVAGQRTSLPDIPLTPKERDILEKTCSNPIRTSHSTESILRDSSPPPKPPLPNRTNNPPPLPPKKRNQQIKQNSINTDSDFNPDSSLLGCGIDHLSSRSRSPDDNSSLLSASAGSLDSAFNQSREEEELKALVMDTSLEDQFLEDDVERMFAQKSQICDKGNEIATTSGNVSKQHQRLSNESGFASMQSIRASMQSVSTKRSSEQSFQSQKSSIASSTDLSSLRKAETFINDLNKDQINSSSATTATQQHQQQHNQFVPTCLSSSSVIASSNIEKQLITSTSLSSSSSANSNIIKNSSSLFSSSTNEIQNTKISYLHKSSTTPISSEKFVDMKSSSTNSSIVKINNLDNPNATNIMGMGINSAGSGGGIIDEVFSDSTIPPALPVKTRNKSVHKERHASTYDNVEETDHHGLISSFSKDESLELRQHSAFHLQSKHQSLIEPRRFGDSDKPPPLPMKKKHIIAYMEICSATSRHSAEQLRHSVHTYNMSHSSEQFSPNRNISHSQTMNLSPVRKQFSSQSTPTSSPSNERPPALPPKKQQRVNNCKTPTIITTPPPSPKTSSLSGSEYGRLNLGHQSEMSTLNEELNETIDDDNSGIVKQQNINDENMIHDNVCESSDRKIIISDSNNEEDEGIDVVLRNNSFNKQDVSPSHSIKSDNAPNLLEEIDISDYLVFKKDGEDGPDVKGGYLDALIVHATKVQKNTDDEEEDAFSEAFITTFRTFITPLELIEKLTHRYTIFCCQVSDQKLKAAKETFSLLVRVVNDLTASDMTTHLLNLLVDFVYQLVCSGQLSMAKLLRNKIVEKVLLYKEYKSYANNFMEEQRNIITNQPTLLDLKSVEIAEQMTLLDAELFQKIEIPEVLLFAKEQCEEKSPNLNKFTEHFNKMSYWARSQILKQDDAKDREKHVIKFIKIMKHLRKINNYNSYLALLSALDSAPIRRLEWHKTITEGLKEYCALIDSSSSFRVYRQALAETNPPCIPYIGLVLQDLTFVHVGNPDCLKDGIINFSKRWQQHNIIVNMKKFKKCSYPFKRNEKIIRFFENFENFFGEEQMWQISENIKPRGKKPTSQH